MLSDKKFDKFFYYNDLTIELHSEVYDPAEDTFQLLEAIKINDGDHVFEIGTGCGIIALVCAKLGADVICSDVNPFAVELVKKNYLQNMKLLNGNFDVRLGDMFSVLSFGEKFDAIIFNPPYLPTKPKDLIGGSGWFDKSVDGGADGLLQTQKFIENLSKHLKKDGSGYFVFSSLSDRKKLDSVISKAELNLEILQSQNFDDERLDICKISKK